MGLGDKTLPFLSHDYDPYTIPLSDRHRHRSARVCVSSAGNKPADKVNPIVVEALKEKHALADSEDLWKATIDVLPPRSRERQFGVEGWQKKLEITHRHSLNR